ncbi:MAG: dockerin type I repeat-containing protein [Eubacteriales bacterium]|nr:dockerin type I repeat-containing protein [Eubacteriales bacterium]
MKVGLRITSCIVALVLLVALSSICVFAADYTSKSSFMYGDVDIDGTVTIKDATLIQKGLAKITYVDAVQKYLADPEADGFSVKNATSIQKHLANITQDTEWGKVVDMKLTDKFTKEIPSDTSLYENNSIIVTAKSGYGEEYTIEDFKEYEFVSIEKIGGVYNPEGPNIYVLYLKNPGTENIVKAIEALEYRANLDLESVTVNGISIAD